MIIKESELLLLAERVVSRYVYSHKLPRREAEDVKMGIVEKFLHKQEQIASKFQGKSTIKTYCIAILNRMCNEMIRKEIKHWNYAYDEHKININTNKYDASQKLLIRDEINALDKIMQLFDDEMHKARIFMAYSYKIPVREEDVKNYDKLYKQNKTIQLLDIDRIGSKAEMFENLAQLVNAVEHKNIKGDAARMWYNKTTSKIILRLNNSFISTNYDKDSLEILFEYYYVRNKRKQIQVALCL